MAYNIGETPGSYVCPECGYRVGEVTVIARRETTRLGRNTILPTGVTAPHLWQTTYTVKSLKAHFARLKSITLLLILAGFMFASGFATKTFLPRETVSESPSGASAKPSSGDTSLNVNTGSVGDYADSKKSIGNPSVTVWVNTKSGIYHCSNTQWYGNTKSGEYMTQREAQSKGYRPAHGSVCG